MNLYYTGDFAVGPDNDLTLVTGGGFANIPYGNPGNSITIIHIAPSLPGFNAQDIQIPSEDGSELYVFDEHGRHLLTLNGLTGATNWVFSYDARNLVTDITGGNGMVTHIQRNSAGIPTAIVGPYGQQTTLQVDGSGYLSKVTNPAGESTTLVNAANGLLITITGPLNDAYAVSYDTNGLVTRVRDPFGGGMDITRTNIGSQVMVQSSTTLTNIETRSLTLLPSGDTRIDASSSDGLYTSTLLQQNGHLSIQYSDGLSSGYDFEGDPRFPQQTRLVSSEVFNLPGGLTSKLTVSHSTRLSDPNNPAALFSIAGITNIATLNGQVYTTTYNGTNRVVAFTSPEGRRVVSGLDAQGRLIHIQSPGEAPLDISYDSLGRVSEVDGTASIGIRRTTFTYDALGRLDTLTDPLGGTNRYAYDSAGRLRQLSLPGGQVAGFQSDAEFNLGSITPPGRPAHHFDYNAVGLMTNYIPPVVAGLNESVGYQYDADRHLVRVSFPDGQNIAATRFASGQISQLELGSGPVLAYSYSSATASNSPSGLLNNIVSSTGDALHFDYQGPFVTGVTWSGSINGSVGVTLNSNFRAASQFVNDSPAVAFGYDRDLLLVQAGGLSITRDSATGFITRTSLGGVTDLRTFDDRGLITNYVASANGTSVWSISLSYDLINRITNKVETIGATTHTFGYIYDSAARLKEVWEDGVPITTYIYDSNGNRLTRDLETATYDDQDRVLSYDGAAFAWSPNGDLRGITGAGGSTNYVYDVRGALTAVSLPAGKEIEYIIDPAGRRIGKKTNGTLVQGFLYQSLQPIAELDAANGIVSRFVYASKPNVPDYLIKGASTYRILSDERGSVRLVINMADGSIGQQLDYDEFGRVILDTAPGFQPFGFAGGLYDRDTALVRFGLRDYSPLTGRWTARDPVSFNGGELSLYNYVGNDPVNSVDPSGLGPYYRFGSGLLAIGGGVLALLAAPAILAIGTTGAAIVGTFVAVSGVVAIGTGSANTVAAVSTSNPATLPTSLPAIVALGSGNSPDAQRAAAAVDLVTGFGVGRFAPGALANTAKALSDANDVVGAADKTATSYGQTPGSSLPCHP